MTVKEYTRLCNLKYNELESQVDELAKEIQRGQTPYILIEGVGEIHPYVVEELVKHGLLDLLRQSAESIKQEYQANAKRYERWRDLQEKILEAYDPFTGNEDDKVRALRREQEAI